MKEKKNIMRCRQPEKKWNDYDTHMCNKFQREISSKDWTHAMFYYIIMYTRIDYSNSYDDHVDIHIQWWNTEKCP